MNDDGIISFGPWSAFFASTMTKTSLFNTIYEAIMNRPSYVILADSPAERKLQVIDELIQFYEQKEDYEKCANLFNIKKEVEIHA